MVCGSGHIDTIARALKVSMYCCIYSYLSLCMTNLENLECWCFGGIFTTVCLPRDMIKLRYVIYGLPNLFQKECIGIIGKNHVSSWLEIGP